MMPYCKLPECLLQHHHCHGPEAGDWFPGQKAENAESTWRSYVQVAKWADDYGRNIAGKTQDKAVKEFFGKRDWTAVDAGNLARIAIAAERLARLAPRLEKVLKLFEIVLKPVAEDVLERSRKS